MGKSKDLAMDRSRRTGVLVAVDSEECAEALRSYMIQAQAFPGPEDLKPEHVADIGDVFICGGARGSTGQFEVGIGKRLESLNYPGKVMLLSIPPGYADMGEAAAGDPDVFPDLFAEMMRTARLAYGMKANGKAHEQNGTTTQPVPNEKLVIMASEIEPKEVKWLWPGIIPLGKCTTFAGMGGVGKSFVAIEIAARLSRGMDWPDGSKSPGTFSTLYVSGEDDLDDTLVPRLVAAGGDRSKVGFFRGEAIERYFLADLEMLSRACDEIGDVKFIVIDPPTNYLGDVDDHKNAQLRSLLSPFKEWTARRGVALVFITHVSKGGNSKTAAMFRVIGGIAWVNIVRSAHLFARDPEDPKRRLMLPMKTNIGGEQTGLSYQLKSLTDNPHGPAVVDWLGESTITADDAINCTSTDNTHSASASELAIEWLAARFREKNPWSATEIRQRAERDHISKNSIYSGKAKELPIDKRRVSGPDGKLFWRWTAKPGWPPPLPETPP